jgi:multidrug efflux system outer membrane protein
MRPALAAIASLMTAACAVGPTYNAPAPAQVDYHNASPVVFSSASPEAQWWTMFGDPVLDQLMTKALGSNIDLKVGLARVEQSRAFLGDARAQAGPKIDARTTYTGANEQILNGGPDRIRTNMYEAGFDASWELDLFGRSKREIEGARADFDAAKADLHGVQVIVAAEVARTYLQLRGTQDRLVLAKRRLATQEENVRLTRVRVATGRGDPGEQTIADADLSAVQATIPDLKAREIMALHRLAVLVGERPGALDILLVPQVMAPSIQGHALPIGDSSDLLRRRPDVQAAERRLAAQTARIGVATADLFPRVSITGFLGLVTGNFASFGGNSSKAWSIAPSTSWSLFDMGSARARLRAQQAKGDETLANYEKTVLAALEDVENGLAAYGQQHDRFRNLADQVKAMHEAARIARVRYNEGVIDFRVLVKSEEALLSAQDTLSEAQTGLNSDVVAIYKALGGGWQNSLCQF